MAPPLTAYHRTPLPPTGVSHAINCQLTSPPTSSTSTRSTRQHLITARDSTLSIYELSPTLDRIYHLRTHSLIHGRINSIHVVKTLQSKRDGKDRILVSFEQAKMTLFEFDERDEFDLVLVSLHTFEKLPQVVEDRPVLIAHDPQSRMTVLHLPTNSGGDGTLAVLPWFTEELDLEGLGMDRKGWEQGGSQIPYAPSHLIPLTSLQSPSSSLNSTTTAARSTTLSSTTTTTANAFLPNAPPPIRNIISLTFLPGFTEPTLALLYAPDLTWSGRLEHLAHNHLVSLVTLSEQRSTTNPSNHHKDSSTTIDNSNSNTTVTTAILISTSPPLPYSLTTIQPIPVSLGIGKVLLKSTNGLLLLDIQGGNLVGLSSNGWFRRDFPPGRIVPPGVVSNEGEGVGELVGEGLEGSIIEFFADPIEESNNTTGSGGGVNGLDNKGLIFCRSGKTLELTIERIGRSISGMKLKTLEEGTEGGGLMEGGSSCCVRLGGGGGNGGGLFFVGSEQGNSKLIRIEEAGGRGQEVEEKMILEGNEEVETEDVEMEEDEDEDDIYGDSSTTKTKTIKPKTKTSSNPLLQSITRTTSQIDERDDKKGSQNLRLKVLDELESYGSIRSLVMGLIDDESPAELVGATGAGYKAGLTIFHKTLPLNGRRSMSLPSSKTNPSSPQEEEENVSQDSKRLIATDGMWVLNLGSKGGEGEKVWIASSEENGTHFYRIAETDGELELIQNESGLRTIYATTMGNNEGEESRTILVLVSSNEIRTFDKDLNPIETIPLSPSIPLNSSARASSTPTYLTIHVGSRTSSLEPRLYRFDQSSRRLVQEEIGEKKKKNKRMTVWRDLERRGKIVRPRKEEESRVERVGGGGGGGGRVDRMEEDEDDDEDEDLYGSSEKKQVDAVVSKQNGMVDDVDEVDGKEKSGQDGEVGREEIGNEDGDWLATVDEEGTLTISLLPSLVEVFRCPGLPLLPAVLSDDPDALPPTISSSIDEDDLVIDRIQFVTLGSTNSVEDEKLHLLVWSSTGTLALFEAFNATVPPLTTTTDETSNDDDENLPPPRLALRFVKTLVHHVPLSTPRRKGSNLPTPARRELLPFDNLGQRKHSGVYVTGEETFWIVKGRQGPARCFEGYEKGVYGFSQAAIDGDCALMTREGLQLSTIPSTVSLNHSLPLTRIPKDRTYSYITFDLDSGMYVGGTLNETKFVAFDDEGNPSFKDPAPGLLEPTNYQSTLELVVPGTWEAIDGYEFRQNEFICTVKTVSLHSKSKANGMRDFIAVGTTVYRGEDLSAKGGIYIFEIVKIVAHPSTPRRDHILKLRFFEDTKSIVGNICDLNGYLFLSMGQKLYARAFEQDEVLIAVGFLDLGVHVTSMTALKNFLLIGDAMQSVALVAFQEDPYRLVFLGRDYRPSRISNANFLVNEGKVSFVTGDDKGVVRMFEYDPTNIASHAGQRLLCRTEYHAGSESVATMLFAKHAVAEDPKQNGILYGGIDGSLYTLVPVRDAVFKRLQSLQTMMSRHVLHFGGLNPRGYRIVKNDTVSRAITKGILDGDLLAKFEYLPLDLQTELAVYCGTDVDTVLANLRNLRVFE